MIGRTLAVAALLFSTQALAQTTPGSGGPAQGVTSGPAAGTPATMGSPQAGPAATKHQKQVLKPHSQSARAKNSKRVINDDGGATGSSTPPYAAPPR